MKNGIFNGQDVYFDNTWDQYTFSDDDILDLNNNKSVYVPVEFSDTVDWTNDENLKHKYLKVSAVPQITNNGDIVVSIKQLGFVDIPKIDNIEEGEDTDIIHYDDGTTIEVFKESTKILQENLIPINEILEEYAIEIL